MRVPFLVVQNLNKVTVKMDAADGSSIFVSPGKKTRIHPKFMMFQKHENVVVIENHSDGLY
jgi:hypothetical protein